MQSRVYPFEGIRNFRNFGDFPTAAGGRVRSILRERFVTST